MFLYLFLTLEHFFRSFEFVILLLINLEIQPEEQMAHLIRLWRWCSPHSLASVCGIGLSS